MAAFLLRSSGAALEARSAEAGESPTGARQSAGDPPKCAPALGAMEAEQLRWEGEELAGALEARSAEAGGFATLPSLDIVGQSLAAAALRRRRRAVMLFAGLMSGCAVARSGPLLYFYRSAYSCAAPQTAAPGVEGWSGSRHCGDAHLVIGDAQRLSSTLLPLQLGIEIVATPLFSALADHWSYRGVSALGAGCNVGGLALLAATAAAATAAAAEPHPSASPPVAEPSGNATTLLLPLGTLCTARLLFGIGGSSVPAATSALFISLSPAAERGSAMVALLCVRAAGMTVGAVLGLGLVRLNLDDYLVCWLALTCLGLVAVAPLLCAAAPRGAEAHRAPATPTAPTAPAAPTASATTATTSTTATSVTPAAAAVRAAPWPCALLGGATQLVGGLRELLRRPLLRVLMLSSGLIMFGWVGPASIIASYVQSAFAWRQGRWEVLAAACSLPAALVAIGVGRRCVLPRHGLLGLLKAGFSCTLLGALCLVGVPWKPYLLVPYVMLSVPGVISLPCAFVLIASAFPQHQQAQALGLFQLCLVLGIGVAVPIYGNYLYRAGEPSRAKQAGPFAIAAVAVALGAATILTAGQQGAGVRADGRARLEDEAEATPPHGGAGNPHMVHTHRDTSGSSEALPAPALRAPLGVALQGGRAPIEAHEERL